MLFYPLMFVSCIHRHIIYNTYAFLSFKCWLKNEKFWCNFFLPALFNHTRNDDDDGSRHKRMNNPCRDIKQCNSIEGSFVEWVVGKCLFFAQRRTQEVNRRNENWNLQKQCEKTFTKQEMANTFWVLVFFFLTVFLSNEFFLFLYYVRRYGRRS